MKPIASISLDLDNEWSYMKTHGDAGWDAFPSYLNRVVPRALDFFARLNWTTTFFVVGQDAALDKNHDAICRIADAGHEIGNHSFHHEPWLHRYDEAAITSELARTEEAIQALGIARPVGFRGPGYSMSPLLLRILANRGYSYDASSLPTFIGPLARAYYFMTAKLDAQQADERKALFGSLSDALRPLDPYRWHDAQGLIEIPVTTMPLLRAPIHFSYLLYLSCYSEALAKAYFQLALFLCEKAGTSPSLLFHPLDFLGKNDVSSLAFFPAMNLSASAKIGLLEEVCADLNERFRVVPMSDHARFISGQPLPISTMEATPC